MEINTEQFTILITAGFGLVRIIEILIVKGFDLVRKRQPSQDNFNRGDIKSELKLMNENHLTHIQNAIEGQTYDNNNWHQKQFEILCEINANLKAKR